MNIKILNHSDKSGGAARAAVRLHHALIYSQIQSEMIVSEKISDEHSIIGPETNFKKLTSIIRPKLSRFISKMQISSNIHHKSIQVFPSNYSDKLNSSNADIVNLHWVCNEMLSIRDIGRINKPLIWTLHDSWPFCGSEHHPDDIDNARSVTGYHRNNRPPTTRGLDLDRWTWDRKVRHWERPINLVSPSKWLADLARKSHISAHWPISVIPNPVPTDIYKPIDQNYCRSLLNLPPDKKIIMFGAFGENANKGWNILLASLQMIAAERDDVICICVGRSEPKHPPSAGVPIKYYGHIYDDYTMAAAYNAADSVVIPSIIENFPQMATESVSCGKPVVGFDTTGVSEIIRGGEHGYLALPYCAKSLKLKIEESLNIDDQYHIKARKCRLNALSEWSFEKVSSSYVSLFYDILNAA